MVNLASDYHLPTAEELPHSDETPVDNELQNNIPSFLFGQKIRQNQKKA